VIVIPGEVVANRSALESILQVRSILATPQLEL
jgi:hypothetical protein